MKKLIVILLSLFLLSCAKEGTNVNVQQNKEDFNVQFLFETDSIRVYRFYDGGHYIYFTNKVGRTSYNYTVNNGKSSHTENIQTLNN